MWKVFSFLKVHLTPPIFWLTQIHMHLLFEILHKHFWIQLNPWFSIPWWNLEISTKTLPFCFNQLKHLFWRWWNLENCNTCVALFNMNHLIEQRYLNKIHLAEDKCKRAISSSGNLVLRWWNYHPHKFLSFLSCFSFANSSTLYLAFHFGWFIHVDHLQWSVPHRRLKYCKLLLKL